MPRGYTDIHLVGGKYDGEIFHEQPLRNLPEHLSVRSETYFAETPNGIAIMSGELNDNWHSYSIEIYAKCPNEKHNAGVIFEFIENRMVNRCSAETQKGRQCLKSAAHGSEYCATHKK